MFYSKLKCLRSDDMLVNQDVYCSDKLNLRSLNEVNVGEQVSKMVVVHSRAPTGRICIRYVIQKCALLGM